VNASGEINTLLCPAGGDHVRQTEASIVPLEGGRLLLAWTDFYGAEWRDEGPARLCGKWSDDQGESWSEPFVLQENTAGLNCMSASLLALESGRLLLAFGRKDSTTLLHAMVRHSDDAGRTWTEPRQITHGDAYWCITNDRLIQLASGRILYPLAEERRAGCHCWISDDEGLSWRRGTGGARPPHCVAYPDGVAYEEPTVVELPDGCAAMFLRTSAGNIHMFRSADGGDAWQPWKTHPSDMCGHADAGPNAARSPCMVKRVPGTGDLLLIWNNNRVRTPLTAALSSDGGESWHSLRNLEAMDGWPPRLTHAYPSLAFLGDNAHITYWETYSAPRAGRLFHLRYRRLPIAWFYET